MDTETVRVQLRDVHAALKRNEEEHEILISLAHGFEGWLRLKGEDQVTTLPLPNVPTAPTRRFRWAGSRAGEATGRPTVKRSPRTLGAISLRQAVREVLEEARGEPLHVKEIYRRVTGKGALSGSKDPESVTDLIALGLRDRDKLPIEKTTSRTWRWVTGPGSLNGELPGGDASRLEEPAVGGPK